MDKKVTIDFSPKSVFVVVLSLIAIWLIFVLRDILVLFFVAFMFATIVEPMVEKLNKKRIPRVISIALVYLLVVIILFALFRIVIPPIVDQTQELINNREVISQNLEEVLNTTPGGFHDYIVNSVNKIPDKLTSYSSASFVNNILGVFSGLVGGLTILVVSFYLLLERGAIEKSIASYWPAKSRDRAGKVFKQITLKVSLWARGQLILSFAVGFLTYIGLVILGIDYAVPLALIAAFTELLPYVGPFIGAGFALIVALAMSPISALWVALLYLGIQQFENHILVPQVMKRTVGLSPVVIIFALLVGAKLLGMLGVLIAVPVAAMVSLVLEEINKKGK